MTDPVRVEVKLDDLKELDVLLEEIQNPKVTYRMDNDADAYRKDAEDVRATKAQTARNLLYNYMRKLM